MFLISSGGFADPHLPAVTSLYLVRSRRTSGYGCLIQMPQSFVIARAAPEHVQPSPLCPRHQYAASLARTLFFTPSGETSGFPSTTPLTSSGLPSMISHVQLVRAPRINAHVTQSPRPCGGPGQHPGQTRMTFSQRETSWPFPLSANSQACATLDPSGSPPCLMIESAQISSSRGSIHAPRNPAS